MQLTNNKIRESIWSQYQIWIKYRSQNSALRTGSYSFVESNNNRLFSYVRADSDNNNLFIVIHNLSSQSSNELNLRATSSSLPEGSYNLVNLLNNDVLGSITITSNGAFNTTLSEVSLEGFNSYLLKLEKSQNENN
jgi:hypothetical protein